MQDFQDRGESYRQEIGIDGTAGDAQDMNHPYKSDGDNAWCLACGLSEKASIHKAVDALPEDMRERVSNLILDYDAEYGSPIDNLDEIMALLEETRRQTASDIFNLAHEYASHDKTMHGSEELRSYHYFNAIAKIGDFDGR